MTVNNSSSSGLSGGHQHHDYHHLWNGSFMFKFEEEFDPVQKLSWMEANWLTACYWISLYLFLIYTGQHVMSTRPAFKLRIPLIVWNVALAVFSIIGTIRTLPEMFYGISNFGFDYTVCDSSYMEPNRACSFWSWLFILSKVPELGDTLFLVLRKRNVIFLHWYHHMTVLLFTWYATASYMSTGRWYIYMNYLVHAIMYSYYALTAIGYRLPKPMAMLITTLQIVQMILGCYVTSRAYYLRSHGASCETTTESAQWALLMYSSYFLLFAHFFVKAYFSPKKNVGSKVGKTEDSLNNNSRRKEEIKCD